MDDRDEFDGRGADGSETYDRDELLSWFGRRGMYPGNVGLHKLGVTELRALAGIITRLTIEAEREGRRKGA